VAVLMVAVAVAVVVVVVQPTPLRIVYHMYMVVNLWYGKQKGQMLPVFALFKCVCCGSIKQRDVNAVVNMYENGVKQLHSITMNEFVIPEGVRENWLLNSRNYSHTAFKDKYRCY
jgi:hypothetical protein